MIRWEWQETSGWYLIGPRVLAATRWWVIVRIGRLEFGIQRRV